MEGRPKVMSCRLVGLASISCLALTLFGCAGQARVADAPKAEPTIQATPLVVTPEEAESVAEIFDRAYDLLTKGDSKGAAELFETVMRADSTGKYIPTAAYNAGLARQRMGERELALERFDEARRGAPDEYVGKLASVWAMRLLGLSDDWEAASEVATALLERGDLTPIERLEAFGAKALGLLGGGDLEAAEPFIIRGRDLIDGSSLGASGHLPAAVAQLRFALGELRRLRSEEIVFVPLPADFAEVLERRCQGLLDAQSAYTDAMRSLDPHWAAMSGYRVGQLYQRLHSDILAVPQPAEADSPEKRLLFEGAMRLRYRVLLEKGLKMMDHTISLGERTGQAPAWIDRARRARDELLASLAEEKEHLKQLPYSEEDLQRVLDDLEKKAAPPRS